MAVRNIIKSFGNVFFKSLLYHESLSEKNQKICCTIFMPKPTNSECSEKFGLQPITAPYFNISTIKYPFK